MKRWSCKSLAWMRQVQVRRFCESQVATAKSLAELMVSSSQNRRITKLELNASPDLVCNNLFCEKVTLPCLCRLERMLEKYKSPESLVSIDLSNNGLDRIPLSLKRYSNISSLDFSGNRLNVELMNSNDKQDIFRNLTSLKRINLSNNGLDKESIQQYIRDIPLFHNATLVAISESPNSVEKSNETPLTLLY